MDAPESLKSLDPIWIEKTFSGGRTCFSARCCPRMRRSPADDIWLATFARFRLFLKRVSRDVRLGGMTKWATSAPRSPDNQRWKQQGMWIFSCSLSSRLDKYHTSSRGFQIAGSLNHQNVEKYPYVVSEMVSPRRPSGTEKPHVCIPPNVMINPNNLKRVN